MRTLLGITLLLVAAPGCSESAAPPHPDPAHAAQASNVAPPTEHVDWRIADRARADVDGDGVREQVRVREPRRFARPYRIQVVVEFADGRTSAVVMAHMPFGAVWSADDIGGSPGDEVLVMREDPRRFVPLTWRGAELVALAVPRTRPISDDVGDRRLAAFWVRDGALWGYRTVDRVAVHWDWVEVPDRYAVRAWRWRVEGLRLRVVPEGRWCVDSARPHVLTSC